MKIIRSTVFPFLLLLCTINTFLLASDHKRVESFNLSGTIIKNSLEDKFEITEFEHTDHSQRERSRPKRFLPAIALIGPALEAFFTSAAFNAVISLLGIADLAIDIADYSHGHQQQSLIREMAENITKIVDSVGKINADLQNTVRPDSPQRLQISLRRNFKDVITGNNDIPLDDHDLYMLDSILDRAREMRFKVEKQIYKHRMVRYLIISASNSLHRLEIRHHEEWNRFNSTQVQMMSDNSEWLTRTKQKTSNQHWYIDDDGNIRSILNDFCLEAKQTSPPELPFEERRIWAKPCIRGKKEQHWVYRPSTKEIRNVFDQNLCLEINEPLLSTPLCSSHCYGTSNQKWIIQMDGYGRLLE